MNVLQPRLSGRHVIGQITPRRGLCWCRRTFSPSLVILRLITIRDDSSGPPAYRRVSGFKVKQRGGGEKKYGRREKKEVVQQTNAEQTWEQRGQFGAVFTLRKGMTKGRKGKFVAS